MVPRVDRAAKAGFRLRGRGGGGIAGLVVTSSVDSRRLSAEANRDLRGRVERARPVMAAARSAAAPSPHAVGVRVEIQDDDGRLDVVDTDSAAPAELRNLVEYVTSSPNRDEHVGPPG